MTELEYSKDELMVVCMARQILDGEVVTQGLATPLVTTAYLLAKQTHAPNLYFTSAIGQGICRTPAPMNLSNIESLWLDRSLSNIGFVSAAIDVLPHLRPKEFFRPGQIDMHGNFNNIAFGRDYARPRMRLPGTGGIPDVSTFVEDMHLYVPRHSRVTFVAKLDFLSGLGYHPSRTHGAGPQYLVSDLGQFDFANGRMRLTTIHPGTALERIIKRTGFELEMAPDLHETPAPTRDEIFLLRNEIDPLGIRQLELMSGSSRRERLRAILAEEKDL